MDTTTETDTGLLKDAQTALEATKQADNLPTTQEPEQPETTALTTSTRQALDISDDIPDQQQQDTLPQLIQKAMVLVANEELPEYLIQAQAIVMTDDGRITTKDLRSILTMIQQGATWYNVKQVYKHKWLALRTCVACSPELNFLWQIWVKSMADNLIENTFEIADCNVNDVITTDDGIKSNPVAVQRDKLRISVRERMASKLSPDEHGDKPQRIDIRQHTTITSTLPLTGTISSASQTHYSQVKPI